MKRLLGLLVLLALAITASAAPLRVFIRGGVKTHDRNVHDHARFLNDWKTLLAARGMIATGALDWPTGAQFAQTDVLVMYAQDGGNATEEQKKNLTDFTKRGGGLVVIHTAVVGNDPAWWKSVIGGAWLPGKTKYKEGPMDLYYTENQQIGGGHPITRGAANFHIDDEIYYDMDISPDVKVLATSYTPNVPAGKKSPEGGAVTIYDIQPQMWAYEKDNYRAFVTIPGHLYFTFEKPHYRALLLRGIAWAGKRTNLDEFCKTEEIAALTYPEGGPQRPADTLKALEIHPDFTLKLVAAEPLINKPMNFDWAPDGSLWVAETPEYPNGRRGLRPDYRGREWKDHGGLDPTPGEQRRKGQDKISRLTDTDGDGVMDKKEIFYEGLDLVTGLVFHRDGVIVTQAPDILWLRDTNGDGKADKVEKLYGGLGASDTHAVINNPRWGWDGWIYATHGYAGSDKVLNAKGEKMPTIGSGVIRFKPDGSAIEQYSSKGGNTWGLTITGDNRVMWTQPTSGELLMQTVLPEYALARGKVGQTASYHVIEPAKKTFPAMTWEQQAYRQIDWVGSFTAAAGAVVYDGGSWPAEYNGDYFTTEPTINIVHHARLTPKGSSFTFHKLPGREETEFIRSRDMWWRPIEVRTGPDGAVYIGDFYNQAVIHNDTRGPDHNRVNAAVRPDRDHYFGRIWRLDHRDAKKLVVPDLSRAGVAELAKALEHPNAHVRMAASRLLADVANDAMLKAGALLGGRKALAPVVTLLENPNPEVRIAAMWSLAKVSHPWIAVNNGLELKNLVQLAKDPEPSVRRAVAEVVESLAFDWREAVKEHGKELIRFEEEVEPMLADLIADSQAPVRVVALRAIATADMRDVSAKALLAAWPKFDDDFQKSAAAGAAAQNPAASIAAALASADPASLVSLVSALAAALGEKNDTAAAAKLIIVLATKPASVDALKRGILDTLGKSLKTAPPMTPELKSALGTLLGSGASISALPLVVKWDGESGDFVGTISAITERLKAELSDLTAADEVRIFAAKTLLGLRSTGDWILPTVIEALTGRTSPVLQRQIVVALGETGDPAVRSALAAAFGTLAPEAQTAAFEVLLKRRDTALALLEALVGQASSPLNASAGGTPAGPTDRMSVLQNLGPANLARLRTFPDPAVSARAHAVLDALLGPAMQAKNDVIAKLAAEVEKPGDAGKGKALFAHACATCHKFGDTGADIGPGLTGMGAHGPAELLTAIVDPNREVDPSFVAWNIETKDGAFHSGIIARENPSSLVLKSLAGQEEIRITEIKSRVSTGRSLMPEGFEGLGAEMLRDILAYMVSSDGGGFRTLDLSTAFTASSARGFYGTDAGKSLDLAKSGTLKIGGVPFNVVAPEKSPSGKNVVNLKGGPQGSYARNQMPKRVEVKVGGFTANRLHFLGGIGGWAYPSNQEKMPVMTCTVNYVDGTSEQLVFNNGVEFADHIARNDVPGSQFAEGITKGFQMRVFSKPLKRTAPIASLVLESADNDVAPTTLAITAEVIVPSIINNPIFSIRPVAELAEANVPRPDITRSVIAEPVWSPRPPAAPAPDEPAFKPQFTDPVPQPPATRPASGPRVLLVGGGSSHDFVKFFGASDKATLTPAVGWVDFTQNLNGIAPILKDIDVLVLSANQPISAATRKALIDYANAGGGIIALHPGTWYAWNNFPQWNKEIIGGGTKGHDALGPYTVTVTNLASPITKGVPATFEITDELYNYNADPAATPIEVLAAATSPKTGRAFPQVWLVKHPKAKIVGLTLGHDAKAHDHPAYRTLLKNAVWWASGR